MAGAGYEIPISASYARTDTSNPIFNANTTFNFSSPWASGGSNDITSRLTDSATATSSAALGGNAVSSANPVQDASGASAAGGASKTNWLPWGIAGAAVIGLAYLWFHR